jgi:glutathione synthase/RimK-type ligase-like ATP-grasp enzyme
VPVRRLAVAASAQHPDLRSDWPLLRTALADLGVAATTEVWTDPSVGWGRFDLVLANGAWDNIHRPDEFLAWARDTSRHTPVVNPPATLRWNMDKRYLAELAEAGVDTVPTRWLLPGEALADDVFPPGEFVVKPSVSGGGFQTARYRAGEADQARAHIARLLEGGRTAMVQPYQETVDVAGETALIFLAGRFSHAVRKGPLLRAGVGTRDDLWRDEHLSPAEPGPTQLGAAREALAAAEGLLGPTTYARVDLITLDDGRPAVLELELLDPALFFEVHPPAVTRFAQILAGLCAGGQP